MVRRRGARRRPWAGWWPWGRVPGLAAGLLLIERQLVAVVGTPIEQVRELRQLGRVPADPVAPVIALLAFVAEALVGYLLLLLVLWSLSLLPGFLGRLTGRAMLLASPTMLHRLLDLLVGGALLAQATLAAPPISGDGGSLALQHMSAPAAPAPGGPSGAAHLGSPAAPMEARPGPRRLAAPLPPWLEGGPSNAAHRYTVEKGDTLWEIAATHLAPADRSLPRIQRYWRRIYRANQPVIGADPDLIHPGTRLHVPPFGDDPP